MTSTWLTWLGLALLAGFATTAAPDPGLRPRPAEVDMDADSLLPARELGKGAYGGPAAPLERVIASPSELEAAWPAAPSLEIDFDREMLVLVALDERRTGGYSVEIKAVSLNEDRLVVEYVERRPDLRCPTLQVITTPYHAVAVPRAEATPRFDRAIEILGC